MQTTEEQLVLMQNKWDKLTLILHDLRLESQFKSTNSVEVVEKIQNIIHDLNNEFKSSDRYLIKLKGKRKFITTSGIFIEDASKSAIYKRGIAQIIADSIETEECQVEIVKADEYLDSVTSIAV